MKVRIEKERNVLVIELPLQTPTPSKSSGKTLVVATTGGNKVTDVQIDGRNITIGVNAYIPRAA